MAGGTLTTGFVDGLGTVARFNYPAGGCADVYGNVFVSDFANSALRVVTSSGKSHIYCFNIFVSNSKFCRP